jgi:hypothetical protein
MKLLLNAKDTFSTPTETMGTTMLKSEQSHRQSAHKKVNLSEVVWRRKSAGSTEHVSFQFGQTRQPPTVKPTNYQHQHPESSRVSHLIPCLRRSLKLAPKEHEQKEHGQTLDALLASFHEMRFSHRCRVDNDHCCCTKCTPPSCRWKKHPKIGHRSSTRPRLSSIVSLANWN